MRNDCKIINEFPCINLFSYEILCNVCSRLCNLNNEVTRIKMDGSNLREVDNFITFYKNKKLYLRR